MSTRRLTTFAFTLALAVPSPALAHGEQLLFLFVYLPPMIVPGVVLLTVWTWQGGVRAKLVTALCVVLSSTAAFAANLAIQYGYVPFPFGNAAYLLVVLAQVAVPAGVGVGCRKAMRRRDSPVSR